MSASEPESAPKPEIVTRHRGLVGRTVLVSALTFLSRILGFVREVVMAALFGDGSAVSDAFFTAWRVPNLFRRLFGEGALSTSLQTSLTEADAQGGNAAGRRLFLQTITLMSGVLLAVSASAMLGVSFLPDRMPVTGWAWFGADPAPVRDLTVRLMPYIVLVCLAAMSGGALHVRGHYAVPSLAPTVMNVCWIGALVSIGFAFGWSKSAEGTRAVVFGTQWDMARFLAWGVLVGGVIQLLILIPPLLRFGLLGRPVEPAQPAAAASKTIGPWHVLKTAAPLAVGAAVYQINVMIDGLMAEGLLSDGGPSALYYANRIQQFPLALVALATINAVFPLLKAQGHLGELGEVRRLYDRAQLGILFLALPAAVGIAVLAHPMASVLFEHGNYGSDGIERIASALRMLAIALISAGAAGLVSRTYIALGDPYTPVKISVFVLVANVGLNVLFVRGFGMDVDGLTLATACTSWANFLWLALWMRAKLGLPARAAGEAPVRPHLVKLLLAAAVSGALAWLGQRLVPGPPFVALGASIGLAMAGYFVLAAALGVPEWAELRRRVKRRFGG